MLWGALLGGLALLAFVALLRRPKRNIVVERKSSDDPLRDGFAAKKIPKVRLALRAAQR